MDPEPEFVLGGLGAPGDSTHLIWSIIQAVPLSDGRIVMLAPEGDTKVLVFEPPDDLRNRLGARGRDSVNSTIPYVFKCVGDDFILGGQVDFDTGLQTVERYRLDRRGGP